MAVTSRKAGGWLNVSVSTAVPPEQVFDFLSDLRRHSEWAATLGNVSQHSEGPPTVGTTYEAQERMRDEPTALERPHRIAWNARTEATGGPMAMRSQWEFLIEPDGAGSRVTQRMRSTRRT